MANDYCTVGIHVSDVAKGQVLQRDQQRVLIVDGDGMLHSVPEELLGRAWFD
jgi:hypothetical protein